MALKPFVKPEGISKPVERSRRRVLYVEDEDINWETTLLNLRDNYDLQRAANSREAFQKLKSGPFDVILMDIQLSGSDLNGIEITQILKGNYSGSAPAYASGVQPIDTPIIFVSAYVARYSKKDLVEKGGADLIPKPVAFLDLSLAITRVITRSLR